MASHECENWDYEKHPNSQSVTEYCKQFLRDLVADPSIKIHLFGDTRPAHREMFGKAVPDECTHLAGNYRGADFEFLRNARVYFGPHEGTIPSAVAVQMDFFHEDLLLGLAEIDAATQDPNGPLKGSRLLVRIVQLMAATLTRFLTIHPYKNGNGHMSRMLVWIGLGKYKHLPVKWWLDESPPGYAPLLTAHRQGDPKPLERYLLKCIRG
jgi:hypothetical protein